MNITVNEAATVWIKAQGTTAIDAYNTKCGEAANNDLSTWRNVGKKIFDYRVSGDYRMVAKKATGGKDPKDTDDFQVLAIYRHGSNGGKEWVAGAKVPEYG